MPESVFLKPTDFYQRNIDPINHYVTQAANYLHMQTGDSLDVCTEYIKSSLKEGKFEGMSNPTVDYYEREDNGDKIRKRTNLYGYIKTVQTEELIMAPSFTCYTPTSKEVSILVPFVDENKRVRSVAKKAAQKAKAAGDLDTYSIKWNEQGNRKTNNNSLSGSFAAQGCVLNNPTAHSTLTSITRCVSSYGNASNERVVGGNRHYWSEEVATNNITSITTNTDYELLERVCTKYSLVLPTVEETMECITRSTNLYWRDGRSTKRIEELVTRLTPLQRAAVVYTGDLWHLRKLNPEFMFNFISRLAAKVTSPCEDALSKIYKMDEMVLNTAHQICLEEVRGLGKDYEKMERLGVLNTLLPTALNIETTINDMKDFVEAFFLTLNVPPTVAYIPSMMRRVVVLSDTDSTCFSADEWVTWYFGSMQFSQEAMGVAAAIAYIATQAMAHNLAIFSANMNVERKRLYDLACKPEWVWPAFMLTSVSKHYCALAEIQESNVFAELEMEIKGVHLKSSAAPPRLTKQAHDMMREILETVVGNKKLSLNGWLTRIADTERFIKNSLLEGSPEFYRTSKIKEASAYALEPERSPYQHYVMWNEIFEPKYGVIEPPPYGVIKIPLNLNNRTAIKSWLDGMVDRDMANRLGSWFERNGKTSFNTFYLPMNYLLAYGIPVEIRQAIDLKKIILDLCRVFYIIVEALGHYQKPEYLVSELGY